MIELMDPNQATGNAPSGQPPLSDIPDDAFGFADESPNLATIQPVVNEPLRQPSPIPVAPTPQPAPDIQVPAPQPVVVPAPPQPVPTPNAPTVPTPLPDIMPPQTMPTVPTLTTPTPQPARPPAVVPPAPAQPIKLGPSFDPRSVPVHASSTSENPITATFTPAPTTHVPEDIAKRIAEHPIQNSEEVLRLARHGFDLKRIKGIVSFLLFTTGIFLAAFLINQFIFQSYYVEGTSMTPTLQNNDRLIISKVERSLAAVQSQPYIPERGQIVVLDSSIVGINGQKEQLIKRVIGLPGDQVHIENGVVTITNALHPDGYDITSALGLTNLQPTYVETPIDLIVPGGHVYVMGDNRVQGGSQDSRMFGPIASKDIQGRLWARILPLDKAQLF